MKWEFLTAHAENREEVSLALEQGAKDGWDLVTVTAVTGTEKQYVGDPKYASVIDVPWFQWDLFFKRPVQ